MSRAFYKQLTRVIVEELLCSCVPNARQSVSDDDTCDVPLSCTAQEHPSISQSIKKKEMMRFLPYSCLCLHILSNICVSTDSIIVVYFCNTPNNDIFVPLLFQTISMSSCQCIYY